MEVFTLFGSSVRDASCKPTDCSLPRFDENSSATFVIPEGAKERIEDDFGTIVEAEASDIADFLIREPVAVQGSVRPPSSGEQANGNIDMVTESEAPDIADFLVREPVAVQGAVRPPSSGERSNGNGRGTDPAKKRGFRRLGNNHHPELDDADFPLSFDDLADSNVNVSPSDILGMAYGESERDVFELIDEVDLVDPQPAPGRFVRSGSEVASRRGRNRSEDEWILDLEDDAVDDEIIELMESADSSPRHFGRVETIMLTDEASESDVAFLEEPSDQWPGLVVSEPLPTDGIPESQTRDRPSIQPGGRKADIPKADWEALSSSEEPSYASGEWIPDAPSNKDTDRDADMAPREAGAAREAEGYSVRAPASPNNRIAAGDAPMDLAWVPSNPPNRDSGGDAHVDVARTPSSLSRTRADSGGAARMDPARAPSTPGNGGAGQVAHMNSAWVPSDLPAEDTSGDTDAGSEKGAGSIPLDPWTSPGSFSKSPTPPRVVEMLGNDLFDDLDDGECREISEYIDNLLPGSTAQNFDDRAIEELLSDSPPPREIFIMPIAEAPAGTDADAEPSLDDSPADELRRTTDLNALISDVVDEDVHLESTEMLTPQQILEESGAEGLWEFAKECFQHNNLVMSAKYLDKLLENNQHEAALDLRRMVSNQLLDNYFEKLAPIDRYPKMAISSEQLLWQQLDHRFGFVLSLIDGMVTFEDIVDVCTLPPVETARILTELMSLEIIQTD